MDRRIIKIPADPSRDECLSAIKMTLIRFNALVQELDRQHRCSPWKFTAGHRDFLYEMSGRQYLGNMNEVLIRKQLEELDDEALKTVLEKCRRLSDGFGLCVDIPKEAEIKEEGNSEYHETSLYNKIQALLIYIKKLPLQVAQQWIDNTVCSSKEFLICSDMYSKARKGDTSDYIKDADSYIATVMAKDSGAYVNKTIKQRLEDGIYSGQNGTTEWEELDLKLSLGSCGFSWCLNNYDKETMQASVIVHITDVFDFNEGNGKRGFCAEILTAVGRKAELASYNVSVHYVLNIKNVKLSEE